MEFYTYILYSEALDKYYVGSSNNVGERLEKHLTNHKGFTAKAKDWVLKYQEAYLTNSEARNREFQIKKWKSRKMIEKLIKNKSKRNKAETLFREINMKLFVKK